jgi:hypothetical protein
MVFAPKIAKPQTKAAEGSTSRLAPQRAMCVGHRLGHDPVEQALFLQRVIGNQGTLRLLARRNSALPGNGATAARSKRSPERTRQPRQHLAAFRGISARSRCFRLTARSSLPPCRDHRCQGLLPPPKLFAKPRSRTALRRHLRQLTSPQRVRMRYDASADRSARLLGAEAVAFGDEILFRSNRYEPRTERGRALIAHELTHVAHQRQTGHFRPQRLVGGDVLSVQFTRAMAEAMTDDELPQQMNILRAHLQENPEDAGAAENLSVLESVAYERQGTARQAPGPEAAPQQPAPADATASMSATDKLIKAYQYANIGSELRSQLEQRFGPKQLVIIIGAGIGVFIAAQFTPVGWIADLGMVLTAAFIGKALFDAFHHLAGFVAAANATTDLELHQAGDEFAKAVAGLEIDTILLILTLLSGGTAGAAGRAASSASAPAGEMALLGADGFVVGTIPAAEVAETTAAITTAQAGQLGLKGAALANAMMSQGGGTGGGGGRLPVPPIPKGVKNLNEFGTKIMKWGTGSAEARARIGTLSRAELDQGGVTREMAEAWRDFYRNEMVRNPANPSAAGRADLMQRAVEFLSGGAP